MSNRVPLGLVAAILMAVGAVALVLIRAFSSFGDGWNDILAFLPFLLGGLAGGVALSVAHASYWNARDRRVARDHPAALVFGSEMTPALKAFLTSHPSRYASSDVIGRSPHSLTVVADAGGLAFWFGSAANPVKLWEIDWRMASGVRRTTHRLRYKNVDGFVVEAPATAGALELAPRPEALYSFSASVPPSRLEELGRGLSERWRSALHDRPGI